MNDEKQKFANGSSLDASLMSKEEKIRAIDYWCEGNQQLKKFLLYFSEKDIETIGCCSGHDISAENLCGIYAYVAIALGKEQDERVIDILAAAEEKKINMNIGFKKGITGKNFCIICSKDVRI